MVLRFIIIFPAGIPFQNIPHELFVLHHWQQEKQKVNLSIDICQGKKQVAMETRYCGIGCLVWGQEVIIWWFFQTLQTCPLDKDPLKNNKIALLQEEHYSFSGIMTSSYCT